MSETSKILLMRDHLRQMQQADTALRENACAQFDNLLSDLLPRVFLAAMEEGGPTEVEVTCTFAFTADSAAITLSGEVTPKPASSTHSTNVALHFDA